MAEQVLAAVGTGPGVIALREGDRIFVEHYVGSFDVQRDDAPARVRELTGGTGVDVVLDCTAGRGRRRSCSGSTRSSGGKGSW